MLELDEFSEIHAHHKAILEKLVASISEAGELEVEDYLLECVHLCTAFLSEAVLNVVADDRELFESYLQSCLSMMSEQEVAGEVIFDEVH